MRGFMSVGAVIVFGVAMWGCSLFNDRSVDTGNLDPGTFSQAQVLAAAGGPEKADRLKKMLGLPRISFHDVIHPIAITDLPLEEERQTVAAGRQVVVNNFSFAPATMAIPAGTTITWTNRDDVPHNVISTEKKFASPVLDTDQTFLADPRCAGHLQVLLLDSPENDGASGGLMNVMRPTSRLCGVLFLAGMLLPHEMATADQSVHEVQILASKFTYEPSSIQVSAGEPVRLVIRSKDGTHGFSIPKLKIDVHIPKTGEPVTVEFAAPPAGRYEIACSEFCGSGHGQMKAALISRAAVTTNQ